MISRLLGSVPYQNPGPTAAWGHQALTATGTGAALSIPVYGQIPIQPSPPSGIYTDTVVVAITY
jgi:spore coat protein U-like protein